MSLPRVPSRAGGPHGFTLIEALIALTLLGVALLLGTALVIQLPRDVRRLDAGRQAMRALEASLEGMRAGTLPVQDSELTGFVTLAGAPAARDLGITVRVEPTARPGLYHVTLTAHYSVLHSRHQKRLEALFRQGG
jgi:prepilin-type N-terminal cleavage/methylation domain-containing protein